MAARRKRQNPYQTAISGNVAYDVNTRGNVAYEPEREERTEQQRISDTGLQRAKNARRQPVELRKQQPVSLTAVAGFVLVAMLAVGVLTSYIQLNSVYAETMTAQTELTELEDTYTKLAAEEEEVFDSETLLQAAEDAGLTEPSASQKVYIEFSSPDNTVVYTQQEQATGLRGCWQAVVSFFTGLGAYFS
ncbi:MAG: hypothetical protein LUC47_05955 [Clostridiales bacterium]|nr:hypothetical protein [Clostridiales bacterium]